MTGYEGISAGVRGYQCRGTRVSVTGYEGTSSEVRGYQFRGTRVLESGHEGTSSGVPGYVSIRAGIRGHYYPRCGSVNIQGKRVKIFGVEVIEEVK